MPVNDKTLSETNDRLDNRPSKSKREISLLLVHGMGEQRPFELIDTFAFRLTDTFLEDQPPDSVKLEMVVETSKLSQPDVRLTLDVNGVSESIKSIEIHEVYWADRPQGHVQ